MSKQGTRIEISPQLHQKINNIYKSLRERGIKHLTKKKVLEELCLAGLEFQKLADQGDAKSVETESGISKPLQRYAGMVSADEDHLHALEEALRKKEDDLVAREALVNETMVSVANLQREYRQKLEEFAQLQIQHELDKQKAHFASIQLEDAKAALRSAKKENNDLKEKIFSELKSIRKHIQDARMMESIQLILSLFEQSGIADEPAENKKPDGNFGAKVRLKNPSAGT